MSNPITFTSFRSNSNNWQETSALVPCPVCGRKEKDCLISENEVTVLCRTRANPNSKHPQPPNYSGGYVFSGKTENDGIFERAIYTKERERTGKAMKNKAAKTKTDLTFLYHHTDGRPYARTRRIDQPNKDKMIWQEYWISDDRLRRHRVKPNEFWVSVSENKVKQNKATPEERALYLELVKELYSKIHLYRIADARALAEETGLPVFVVEGELCCDLLLSIGLPAVTCIGGSRKWDKYGGEHGNYTADLEGIESIIIAPDCDKVGIEHGLSVESSVGVDRCQWLYSDPTHVMWTDVLGKGRGQDVKDWVEKLKLSSWSDDQIRDQILRSVEGRREIKLKRDEQKTESVVQGSLQPVEGADTVTALPIQHAMVDPESLEPEQMCKTLRLKMYIKNSIGRFLKLNELTSEIEFKGQPIKLGRIKLFLAEKLNIDTNREDAMDIISAIAEENAYHPIRDYLNKVYEKYGDSTTDLLKNASARYLGTEKPLYESYVRNFAVGAVARIFEPGCKMDDVLILQGKQALGKSTFFRLLAGEEGFDDSLGSNIEDKDEVMKLHQSWIQEWGEFDRITGKREANAIKPFVTRQKDSLRLPYDRAISKKPRASVIVGTVNPECFLMDSTGNRRYRVIPLKQRIDKDLVTKERDAFWAAAVALYKNGTGWQLTDAEEKLAAIENRNFEVEDSWYGYTAEYIQGKDFVVTSEIMRTGIELDKSRQDAKAEARIRDCLRRLGWQPRQNARRVNGVLRKGWEPEPQTDFCDVEEAKGVNVTLDVTAENHAPSTIPSTVTLLLQDNKSIEVEKKEEVEILNQTTNSSFSNSKGVNVTPPPKLSESHTANSVQPVTSPDTSDTSGREEVVRLPENNDHYTNGTQVQISDEGHRYHGRIGQIISIVGQNGSTEYRVDGENFVDYFYHSQVIRLANSQ